MLRDSKQNYLRVKNIYFKSRLNKTEKNLSKSINFFLIEFCFIRFDALLLLKNH